MKKINQLGFSPIAILLVLILVVLVGFTGYYVYNAQKKDDKGSPATNNNPTLSDESKSVATKISDSSTPGWITYADNTQGFKLDFPTQVLATACEKSDTIFDNYGNKIPVVPSAFTTKSTIGNGMVVFSNETNRLYISSEKTTKLAGLSKAKNLPDRDIYTTCEEIAVTGNILDEGLKGYTGLSPNIQYSELDVYIAKVSAADIAKTISQVYPVQGLSVTLSDANSKGVQIVKPNVNLTNGRVDIRYIPKSNLLSIWSLGQACQLALDINGEKCADTQILNSLGSL